MANKAWRSAYCIHMVLSPLYALLMVKDLMHIHLAGEGFEKTGQICRLIWICDGHIGHTAYLCVEGLKSFNTSKCVDNFINLFWTWQVACILSMTALWPNVFLLAWLRLHFTFKNLISDKLIVRCTSLIMKIRIPIKYWELTNVCTAIDKSLYSIILAFSSPLTIL